MDGVVCFSEFLTDSQKFGGNQFEAAAFQAGSNLTNQTTLHAIRFYNDKCFLHRNPPMENMKPCIYITLRGDL